MADVVAPAFETGFVVGGVVVFRILGRFRRDEGVVGCVRVVRVEEQLVVGGWVAVQEFLPHGAVAGADFCGDEVADY